MSDYLDNLERMRAIGAARAKAEADAVAGLDDLINMGLEKIDATLESAVEADEVIEVQAPKDLGEIAEIVVLPAKAASVPDGFHDEDAILADIMNETSAASTVPTAASDADIEMDADLLSELVLKIEQSEAYESQTTTLNVAALRKGAHAQEELLEQVVDPKRGVNPYQRSIQNRRAYEKRRIATRRNDKPSHMTKEQREEHAKELRQAQREREYAARKAKRAAAKATTIIPVENDE